MITKMTKYSFVLLGTQKSGFLEDLQELGVVDITRSTKAVDEESERIIKEIEAAKAEISVLKKGSDTHLEELIRKEDALKREYEQIRPWGEYDRDQLAHTGLEIHFYTCPKKKFDPAWENKFPLQVIAEENGTVYFVAIGSDLDVPAKEVPQPECAIAEMVSRIEEAEWKVNDYRKLLQDRSGEIPSIEKKIEELTAQLNLYLANAGAKGAADNSLAIFQGFAPVEEDERLKEAFDSMDGVLWFAEKASAEDNPPIKFRNNKFVKLFEPLTDMYGRPAYNGFDPTPYISIFFLLFFAICMGDAGYGLLLMIVGFLLKKSKGFAKFAPLVVVLGAGTVVVGLFFHTFFSMDISTWSFIPDWMKKVMVPSKVGDFDGTMVLALIIGIVHLCLAMSVKAIYAVKNNGFVNSLGVCGWTLLIVGGVVVGAMALAGVMDSAVTKTVIIVLGIVSALGIFVFNDIHRNPLLNVGSGLWETYNTVTGILGDVLSYLRLYALGLAGSMLGFAFNDLAKMALGDGGFGWVAFILIVVIGHTLNLAMAALGAFVHPLRLNFLEFFKNSGYEASGRNYNPLKK